LHGALPPRPAHEAPSCALDAPPRAPDAAPPHDAPPRAPDAPPRRPAPDAASPGNCTRAPSFSLSPPSVMTRSPTARPVAIATLSTVDWPADTLRSDTVRWAFST